MRDRLTRRGQHAYKSSEQRAMSSCQVAPHKDFGTAGCSSLSASRARGVLAAALFLVAISACAGQQDGSVVGAPRLATPRMAAAVGSVGGRIYVIGGVSRSGAVSNVSECDPLAGLCSEKAPLAAAVIGASVADVAGLLYVTGGVDSHYVLDHLIVYTPLINGWASKRPLPTPRWNHMSAATGGQVYVFGGIAGTGAARRVLGDVWAYQPEGDQWEDLGAMPGPVQAAAVAVVNGKVYLIGGRTETQPTATASAASTAVYEFDAATRSWRTRRYRADAI